MGQVSMSRYTPGLKPGMGEDIQWHIGEVVLIVDGVDKGRRFVVCSQTMSHPDCPGNGLVREGYFEDDPTQTKWAKAEALIWFVDQPEPYNGE